MAKIDPPTFATECIEQGNTFGAWAHYLVAVAKLRSGIDDAVTDGKTGPFGLTQEQWNGLLKAELGLEAEDIKTWQMQCLLVASWTHDIHRGLVTANGRNPTSEEIYGKQFPGNDVAGLDQALTDTRALMPSGQAVAAGTALDPKAPT